MSKFTVYTDKNNDFRWKFSASNDQVVARSSEAFRKKEDCLKSLALLQSDITGAVVDPVVQAAPSKFPDKNVAAAPAAVAAVAPGVTPK